MNKIIIGLMTIYFLGDPDLQYLAWLGDMKLYIVATAIALSGRRFYCGTRRFSARISAKADGVAGFPDLSLDSMISASWFLSMTSSRESRATPCLGFCSRANPRRVYSHRCNCIRPFHMGVRRLQPHQGRLAYDGGRIGVSEKNGGRATTIGGCHPNVVIKSVEYSIVIQPLDLVIDTALLGECYLSADGQVHNVDMPTGLSHSLECDPLSIRSERRALDSGMQDAGVLRCEITFDQVILATCSKSGIEVISIIGKGDTPIVKVDSAELFAVALDG